ncbi:MAG TPA: hypothetical protein VJ826_12935 [Candidatus Polarisedimenticolaceae bacterium]|nr:hypothetical protein [Candidatus Polarisedimenticolaceae bacterium]
MRIAAAVFAIGLASAARAAESEKTWAFSATAYGYDVPDDEDFVNPGFTADRGMLHLEARYNYEALDSASIWGGANFSVGKSWVFDSTVMLGGVFGDAEGFAPGFRLSLTRDWLEITSEAEYYIDNHDHEENFFYTWSEIAGYPLEWFRLGVAVQRTRAYQTDLDVQRGPFVGFTWKQLDVSAYVFNPASDDATYTLGLGVEF